MLGEQGEHGGDPMGGSTTDDQRMCDNEVASSCPQDWDAVFRTGISPVCWPGMGQGPEMLPLHLISHLLCTLQLLRSWDSSHQSHFTSSFCIGFFKCQQQEKMRLCKMTPLGEVKGDADSAAALILQIQSLTGRYTQKYPAVKKMSLSLASGC